MEVIATEINPWAFMYDLFAKLVMFAVLPILFTMLKYKKEYFKVLILVVSTYVVIAAAVIISDYVNDYAFIKDYKNNDIATNEFFIENIEREVKKPDYFIEGNIKYRFLMNKDDDFWDDNFEGHLCEVEYYTTSHRIIRIKVVDK